MVNLRYGRAKREGYRVLLKKVQSVADAIPFDPDIPSNNPPGYGYRLAWDDAFKVWGISDASVSHKQVFIPDIRTTTTNGTLNLLSGDHSAQVLLGSGSNYRINLPSATELLVGHRYEVYNTTSFTIGVWDYAGNFLFTLAQNSVAYLYLRDNSTSAGAWVYWQILASPTASGIINYAISQNTTFSTTSATDTIITGFTLSPQDGTYGCWFSGDAVITANNNIMQFVFYKGGVAYTDSRRIIQGSSSNFKTQMITMAIIQFSGSENIDLRINSQNGNNISVNSRSMLLIRLGP